MLTWHYVTRAAYDAAESSVKTSDKLFFLSDTKEIYRGTENFTESVILYSSEPAVKAVGKLYINSTTLEGKIWNGSAWTTVIQPVQSTVDAANTNKPVSGAAVTSYVATEIAKVTGSGDLVSNVEYVADTKSLKVSMADGTDDAIQLTGLAVDLDYDAVTGKIMIKDATGKTVGTGINIDLERFVSAATYDHDSRKITLSFNDSSDPLEIDIGDLVDTYTAKSGKGVSLTVTGNEFTAEAIVSTAAGNMLSLTDAGLFVAATDISAKADRDTDAVAGNVAKFDDNGNAVDAGYTLGGATVAASASATVLATEAAVAAIRDSLSADIATKMNKVGSGHTGEIIVADANGDASASGYKLGGATLSDTPNAATAATEVAVVDYVEDYAVAKVDVVAAGSMATSVAAASDTKVTSEKAVVDAMSWKTTV